MGCVLTWVRHSGIAWRLVALTAAVLSWAGVGYGQAPTSPVVSKGAGVEAGSAVEASGADAVQGSGARGQLSALYAKVRGAVVRIETEAGVGSGFVYHSKRHVATALHVVEYAEEIQVYFDARTSVPAVIVAYDAAHDVALLELSEAYPDATPLAPYLGPLAVGTPLAVIGHPYSDLSKMHSQLEGLLNWSLTQGVVGAVSRAWVQTDAQINPGNSGGPVLSLDGRVIGVVSARLREAQGIGIIARVKHVEALTKSPRTGGPPAPDFTRDVFEFGFAQHHSSLGSLSGFALGAGVVYERVMPVRLRFLFVSGEHERPDETVLRTGIDRFDFEASAGYRFEVVDGVSVTASLGAAVFINHLSDLYLLVPPQQPDCTAALCPVQGQASTETRTEVQGLPTFGADVGIGLLGLGYSFQLDVDDADRSIHRVLVALRF